MTKRWMLYAAMVLVLSLATQSPAEAVKVLIITGDHGHDWKATTPFLQDLLGKAGMSVDVTKTPAKDLTAENLAKYDVLLLNYKDNGGPPETRWSDENKKAFADAVKGGKGLVCYHFASAAFVADEAWSKEYERIIAGGWRKQGFHGKRHEYTVTIAPSDHPITRGLAGTYQHANDELYQNSVMFDDNKVLATAWSDKKKDPKNTDKNEPMLWVSSYGKGRVCNEVLGHDVPAMQSEIFKTLMVRAVEWAGTGDVKSAVPETLKQVDGKSPKP